MLRTEKVDRFELPSIHRHCTVCKQYMCNYWTEMTEGCRASRVSKLAQLVQWTFGVWVGRGKNECPAVRSDDAPDTRTECCTEKKGQELLTEFTPQPHLWGRFSEGPIEPSVNIT
jgi:hypothetical protein